MPSCGRDTSRDVPATIRGDGLDRPRGPSNPIVGEASPRPTIKQQFLDSRDWPFGSVLSIMLTLTVLLLAAIASWAGSRHKKKGKK